jgi:tRNA 2-thiouridine synthesizing protein E
MLSTEELSILCTEKGFLRDVDRWNKDIAVALASLERIELTEAHWEVIALLRQFYDEFGDSPANRALVNYVKRHLGSEKGQSAYLMGLFPDFPARRASRIAGLPKPKHCL